MILKSLSFLLILVTLIDELDFKDEKMILTLPMLNDPYIHIEWLVNIKNYSSMIIFDIENFDGNTPAELILPQSKI